MPEDIETDDGKKYRRMHTYSKTNKLEVVDLSNFNFDAKKILNRMRTK